MMQTADELPVALKPFAFHGVDFNQVGNIQAQADCPFCGKENKLHVHPLTGQWDCKAGDCGRSGNVYGFLDQWIEHCHEHTSDQQWAKLSKDRGIRVSTLKAAELAWDGSRWLIPCRNENGTVMDVRIWRPGKKMLGTAGLHAQLWNCAELHNSRKRDWLVCVCEGEWDGIALKGLAALLKLPIVVVAVPGAKTFKTEWVKLFNDRKVWLLYDNDQAGDDGMRKVGIGLYDASGKLLRPGMLASNTKGLKYARWPANLPEKYDLRDLIIAAKEKAWKAIEKIAAAKPRFLPLPAAKGSLEAPEASPSGKSSPEASQGPQEHAGKTLKKGKAVSFEELCEQYCKFLKLSPDAIGALKSSLAVVLSNQFAHEPNPLWLFLVGPPGSGKTTMVQPFAHTDHCVFRSSLGPKELVSGYPGNPDPSLLPLLDGKTLVLKDVTELLAAPAPVQEEVFGTLRGAYDGTVERSYGNGVKRNYTVTFSMIAGVTNKIHGQSRASMGERTLKYQLLPHGKAYDASSIIGAAISNIGRQNAVQQSLGEITKRFLDRTVKMEKVVSYLSNSQIQRITALAQIIAQLRAEVERKQYGEAEVLYRPQAEVATRLAVQFSKMGMLFAEIGGKGRLLDADYQLLERIAFDTAIGWHLDVVQAMMAAGDLKRAKSLKEIADAAKLPTTNTSRKIDDLVMLGILRKHHLESAGSHMPRIGYTVADQIMDLWHLARVGQQDHASRMVIVRRRRTKES